MSNANENTTNTGGTDPGGGGGGGERRGRRGENLGDHQGMTQSEQMAAIEAEARAHAIAQQAAAEGAEDLTGGETGEGGADGDAVVAVGDTPCPPTPQTHAA